MKHLSTIINVEKQVLGNCDFCGKKKRVERITFKNLILDFVDATFSLEHGFFSTVPSLIKNPQSLIAGFLNGIRNRYTLPAKFLIVSVTIAVLTSYLVDIQASSYLKVTGETKEKIALFFQYYLKFLNLILLALVPVMSLSSWLIYNPKKINFAEHLVINAYVTGLFNLLTAVGNLLAFFFESYTQQIGNFFQNLGLIWIIYSYSRIFGGFWLWAIIKAFISAILMVLWIVVFAGLILWYLNQTTGYTIN